MKRGDSKKKHPIRLHNNQIYKKKVSILFQEKKSLSSNFVAKTFFSPLHIGSILLLKLKGWRRDKSNIKQNTKVCTKKMLFFLSGLKLSCHTYFQHTSTACICVFKEITFVGSNHRNYFENANACSKRTLRTTVATQL